jgi:hypothetical protein
MTKIPTINRRGWLAVWLQKKRRERALILSSDGHGHLTWISNVVTICGFNIYRSDDGINWSYYDTQYPDLLYRDCSGQSGFFRISGADDDGNPILPYSNVVYSDGLPLSAPGLNAPTLVSLGTVAGDTTWRAVAPVAVDDWQFCTTDSVFDPAVKSFDQWVADADFPDTEFVTINAATATVTADFTYCAARYRVGTTWSSWTGVVDATVIEPPAQLVLSSDGHGHLTWTLNFVPPSDASQPGVPYDTVNIYKSADGVTWPSGAYDGWNLAAGNRNCSGDPGYFRICICDWDGIDVPPYSNAVYSDGL